MRIFFAFLILCFSLTCAAQNYFYYAKAVAALDIAGKHIERGMTHDAFLRMVGFRPLSTTVEPDEELNGSLRVFKRYLQGDQKFLIEFRREALPGPYIVHRIRLPAS